MSHYHHLTINERETLLEKIAEGKSINQTAHEMSRSPSTISRELKRNLNHIKKYSASTAQNKYYKRRQGNGRRKLNQNGDLYQMVRHLFLDMQWSPEQISNCLKLEQYPVSISGKTGSWLSGRGSRVNKSSYWLYGRKQAEDFNV